MHCPTLHLAISLVGENSINVSMAIFFVEHTPQVVGLEAFRSALKGGRFYKPSRQGRIVLYVVLRRGSLDVYHWDVKIRIIGENRKERLKGTQIQYWLLKSISENQGKEVIKNNKEQTQRRNQKDLDG